VRMHSVGAAARVEVEDSGPGITEAFQSRVFEKFSQAESSSTRRFPGTGLGLSIARNLVEAMGGSIGFTTVVGRGTIFYFELPRAKMPAIAAWMPLLAETAAQKILSSTTVPAVAEPTPVTPTLLYVQDDKDLVSLIRAALNGKVGIVEIRGVAAVERALRERQSDRAGDCFALFLART